MQGGLEIALPINPLSSPVDGSFNFPSLTNPLQSIKRAGREPGQEITLLRGHLQGCLGWADIMGACSRGGVRHSVLGSGELHQLTAPLQ